MNHRTRSAIERQITAMGTDVFEVGLFKPRTLATRTANPKCCPVCGTARHCCAHVSWLCFQNAHGRNVYVRPNSEHHLSLVDDLTAEAIQRMKAEGFTPAIVVETSPGNFQAWLNHGQVLPKQLSTLQPDSR